jgi:hypothetical protein
VRRLILVAALVLGSFAVFVVLGPGKRGAPHDWRAAVLEEAQACYAVVRGRTDGEADRRVPHFSTREMPGWASPLRLAEDPDHGPVVRPLAAAIAREWGYRVPASVAGRPWDAIGDDELVIEVVDRPIMIDCVGIRKDGRPALD